MLSPKRHVAVVDLEALWRDAALYSGDDEQLARRPVYHQALFRGMLGRELVLQPLMTIELPGVIAWILVGLVAGWLASTIMGRRGGILGNVLLGLVGALVGGVLFSLIGLGGATNIVGSIVIATVGAVLILAIVGR